MLALVWCVGLVAACDKEKKPAPAPEKHLVRLRIKAGDVFRYRVNIYPSGEDEKSGMSFLQVWTVTSATENEIAVKLTYDAMSILGREATADELAELGDSMRLGRRGETIDDALKPDAHAPDGGEAQQLADEAATPVELPESPIGIGSKWTAPTKRGEAHYELKSIEKDRNRPVGLVQVTFPKAPLPPLNGPGKIWIYLDDGMIKRAFLKPIGVSGTQTVSLFQVHES